MVVEPLKLSFQIPLLSIGQWFSPSTLMSSTNKTDRHDITEILLKVALNNINQTNQMSCKLKLHSKKLVNGAIICMYIFIYHTTVQKREFIRNTNKKSDQNF
jgi:hypothetical protein